MSKTREDNKGFTLRELNSRGNKFTDRYIQYHPGNPRHYEEDLVGKYLLVKAEHKDFLQNNMKG